MVINDAAENLKTWAEWAAYSIDHANVPAFLLLRYSVKLQLNLSIPVSESRAWLR